MAHPKESEGPKLDQIHTAQPPAQVMRSDGVVNPRTGTGTARSKQNGVWFNPRLLSVEDAKTVWLASDMAKKIVNLPAEEMTRAGVSIRIPDDHEGGEAATAQTQDLCAPARFQDAISKMRCMGGACVMVNVTDGVTDPSLPINEKGLRSVDSLTVFEPGEVQVFEWIANPAAKDYGTPASYQINPRVVGQDAGPYLRNVHKSRIIRFTGPMISRDMLQANHGFGVSILDHCWEIISRFDQNYDSTGALIDDFAQAVYKIKGLYRSMTSNGGADVKKRLELMDAYRSMLRGIALDADGEDFERKPTPMAGLADVIDRFGHRLAAAADMPLAVLMGKSPSGLAASGDMDVRIWYDQIGKLQQLELKPAYDALARLIFLAKEGPTNGVIPENWSLSFNPLWQETSGEKATTRLAMAQADQIYLVNSVVDAEEIRESRFGGDEFSVDTQIDDDTEAADAADDLNEGEGTTTIDPVTGEAVQTMPGQAPGAAKLGAPGAAPAGGALTPADTAMNGIQVTAMVSVITAVVKGEISRESGAAVLVRAFRVSEAEALKILGPESHKPPVDPMAEAKIAALTNPKPVVAVPGQAVPPKQGI